MNHTFFLSHDARDLPLVREVALRLRRGGHQVLDVERPAPLDRSLVVASHIIVFASAGHVGSEASQVALRAVVGLRRESDVPVIVMVCIKGVAIPQWWQPTTEIAWGSPDAIVAALGASLVAEERAWARTVTSWPVLERSTAKKALQFILDRAPRASSAGVAELQLTFPVDDKSALEMRVRTLLAADNGFTAELRAELRIADVQQRMAATLRADLEGEGPGRARAALVLAAEDATEKFEKTWERIYENGTALCPTLVVRSRVRAVPPPESTFSPGAYAGAVESTAEALGELAALLGRILSVDEFRRMLAFATATAGVLQQVHTGTGPAEFFAQIVQELDRRALICENFFDRLVGERPLREAEIRMIQARFPRR